MDERIAKVVSSDLALDDGARLKIEATLENYPGNTIFKIYGYPNADFTDEEDSPKGLLSIHPIEAKVNVDSIPEEMFKFMVICPIIEKNNKLYTDADFTINAKLDEAVVQYSDKPPSMHIRNKHNADMDTWNSELNSDGFAGIFKKVRENNRDADYFVVVQAGAPVACAEFKDYLNARSDMTFKDLVEDPKFSYTQNVARRNAERIAYNVARAYSVPIAHTVDVSSHKKEQHSAQPMRAEPPKCHRQALSTIKVLPQGFKSKESVAIFHEVRPVSEVNDVCFVCASPYEGIVQFNMNGNGIGYGLPATTGRQQTESTRELSQKEMTERTRGITWEGKDTLSFHPDLHPDAFKKVDSKFLKSMKNLGWRQEGTDNREKLVPVVLKLGNPDKKRTN